MALEKYRQKRRQGATPEPFGGKSDTDELRFVVQKHAASHLHYDFRLEMRGVLKSWAVPKGPSLDPSVKRLAMMVEDHPYDYRNFEGIIPQGEYGGGTVIVWDEGTYVSDESEATTKKEREKELLHGLHSGKLKFTLKGKKLKGSFALVKTSGRGENAWLLIKHKDRYADTEDILEKDKSVRSRKTIEQVARTSTNIYGHPEAGKEKKAKKPATAGKSTAKRRQKKDDEEAEAPSIPAAARKTPFPRNITPMLATLVDEPVEEEGWVYEIKWDGYRALALMNKGKVELKSRNDKSFNEKFYPVYDTLKAWKVNAVIDGEVVVLNDEGMASFGALQNWRSEADGELRYYVFDLLWYEGYDLRSLPLYERRALLKQIVPPDSLILYSDEYETSGAEFLKAARNLGLEGIMAKRKDSTYESGERSKDWLKIKANRRQEVVIGGYTKNAGSSKPFSALLVGVFEKGKFLYTGKVGTGFNLRTQKEMLKMFRPYIVKTPPFSEVPDVNKPSRFRPDPPKASATWLKPELVCEVSFAEMTSDGVMRHPSFEGMREDKNARQIVLEKEADTDKVLRERKKQTTVKVAPPRSKGRGTLLNPSDETQVRKVNGHELKFGNLSKEYWPGEGITKRDLINYYYQVAPFMLPYLKDRPQSLNRHPNGIKGMSFYQKDVTGKVPEWIDTYLYHSEGDDRDKHFLVGRDEATLLYMASLGCIEINPWSSTTKKPDHPTWCIIDLDPDKNTFDQVIKAAQVTKSVLDDLDVPSYCKTSGSTGLHVYIPLGNKYTYEQSKEFARVVVTLVQERIPEFTTIERSVSARKGKMYLDFLQNRPQATIAAPYSVRPKPGATVSMPLHWEEVKKGLKMKDFTIFNAIERLKSEGDLFKPVLGKGINLQKIIKEFSKQASS